MAILDPKALEALTLHQRQLDMDGVEVGVSRQALDELISAYLSTTSAGVTEEQTPRVTCQTCNGHGMIGALMPWGDGQVDSVCEPCPDCAPVSQKEADTFQDRVQPWMMACFGPEISADRVERADRLLEEVFELLQSGGYDPARVLSLRDYVWGRDIGEPAQEVGGVQVTLAAYCLAHDLDMHVAGETELARIWTKVEKIRAKQAAKPTGSALPVAVSQKEAVPVACDEDNMPERIWAGDFNSRGFGHCVIGQQGGLYAEYVRADLAVPPDAGEPSEAVGAAAAGVEELERKAKAFDACDWYWPEDDTSSEACADNPFEILGNNDAPDGEVWPISRGGVIETRFYASLSAADDSHSDDRFDVDEPTLEAAKAKIEAELTRRSKAKEG